MKLVKFCLKGFRSYEEETCISLDNLTAIIGKNDAGKSSILEAMDTFFNGIKLDSGDYTIGSSNEITLTAIFEDFPEEVIFDSTNSVIIANEHLLNEHGQLEVKRVFKGATPALKETYLVCNHPQDTNYEDLLTLKIKALRDRANDLGIDLSHINQTVKSEIRHAIWESKADLSISRTDILVKDEDTKKIGDSLFALFPTFSLFRSDRPSTDQDGEAQDPMQAAIKEAMKSQEDTLKTIAEKVEKEVKGIAEKTVQKLKEMDPDLADELIPTFKTPDWAKAFKVSLTSDDSIPLNKRGSGVRRLVLLNFFRVKAEQGGSGNTIYAIEEPETAQHPDKQKLLMQALTSLSEQSESQVLFTTHTPMLTSLIDDSKIRYVKDRTVINEIDDVNKAEIAQSLGVLPDNNVKVFIGVEGSNDISFLKNISKVIKSFRPDSIDLESLEREGLIVFIPFGGSNFKLWVNRLNQLNRPEIHICDSDKTCGTDTPAYQNIIDAINQNPNSTAIVTSKRQMENYIHHDAILDSYRDSHPTLGLSAFNEYDDIPVLLAAELHSINSEKEWHELTPKKRDQKESKVKKKLNENSVLFMNEDRLSEIDGANEIIGWIEEISKHIEAS